MKKLCLLCLIILALLSSATIAQDNNDTIKKTDKKEKPLPLEPYHLNVIKFNPTPMMIWDNKKNVTLAYERLFNKSMSASVQLGYLLFPNLLDDTVRNLVSIYERNRHGINAAVDYRYYPFARNRRPAPDGVFIGGYVSYYGFQFENKFDILHTSNDQQGTFDGKVNIINFGFDLGYQFIFWKRFSLDLILFAPSYSIVSGNINIKGEVDADQIDQELVDKLLDRFPYLGSVFSSDGLTYTGTKTQITTLLRYSVSFGFHF